jgi:hypothetical protein
MRRTTWLVGMALLLAGPGYAEEKLALIIPTIFGAEGLKVDSASVLPNGQTHSAHFNGAFQTQFTQFNVALASQLTSLPVPSPASGFSYTFDASLGLFSRTTDSFGPILTDRADTAGKKKLSAGVSYQHFGFDSIEGVPLDDIPAVFTHDNPARGGRDDVVSTTNAIDSSLDQVTMFVNYGVASRLDVAVAVPFVSAEMSLVTDATIKRIGTVLNPKVHYFADANGNIGDSRIFQQSGSASGIGDLIVRVKGKVGDWGSSGIGLGVDARFPTGDEENLLGSGAYGLKPFLVFSSSHKVASFNVNAAYQWNGNSVLAGNVVTGTKDDFPDQVIYSAGATFAFSKKATLAVDVLGRTFIDTPRLRATTFTALDGVTQLPDVSFQKESFTEVNGAVGLRANLKGGLLFDLNVLFKLNNTGLRDKLTPLVGFEYSF